MMTKFEGWKLTEKERVEVETARREVETARKELTKKKILEVFKKLDEFNETSRKKPPPEYEVIIEFEGTLPDFFKYLLNRPEKK